MNLDSAVFYSHNIEKVTSFYRDVLGLKIDYKTDNFVSFIFPNGARLGIKNKSNDREVPGHQTVFITVKDIESWFNKCKTNLRLVIHKDLETKLWGREFSILDPDKNKVLFIAR